jgi:hypothetical protein
MIKKYKPQNTQKGTERIEAKKMRTKKQKNKP